jgi:predicted O-methyltransferase YrrM
LKEIAGGINSAGSGALRQRSDSEGEAVPDQDRELHPLTSAVRNGEAATSGHQSLLLHRESEIAALSEALVQLELQLSSIEEVVRKREGEVSAAAALLRLRESTIASLENQLRRKGAEIEDILGLLQLREATIGHLEDLLRLRESEIQSASSIVRLREERISTLERLFAEPAAHGAAPEWRALPLDEKVSHCLETTDGWCSPKKAVWLAQLIVSRQVKNVLEVGIFGGKSLIPIALAVQSAGGGIVIGVEPWSAEVAISEPTDETNDTWWASVDFALVKERFFANSARYGVLAMIKVMEMDSESAFRFLEPGDRQFDLIHIDGAHSPERALRDAKSWSKLVKKGGLVVFDDIGWPSVALARDFLTRNLTVIDEVFESGEVSYGAYEAPL